MTSISPETIATKVVEPNKMVYTDGQGVRREIYMARGTLATATKHLQNEAWDELAKFPKWANQQYTEADFFERKE